MAKSKDDANRKTTDPTKTSLAETKPSSNTRKPSKPGTSPSLIFFILVSLLALVLAAHASYQLWRANTKPNPLEVVNRALKQQNAGLQKMDSRWQATTDALSKKLKNAISQRFYQQQDWQLLKAQYYLEIAQINYHWSDDTKVTLELLREADGMVQNLTSEQLLALRQALAKEISQLEAQKSLDVPGILSQLDALQTLVTTLAAANNKANTTANIQAEAVTEPSWRKYLHNSLDALQKLVVVSHYEGNSKLARSPGQKALLALNIQMNLVAAQWAVLHNDTQLYRQSLQQAERNSQQILEKEAAQPFLKQLHTLQNQDISRSKAPLGESLHLINKWIESNNGKAEAGEKMP